jgi:hypothetical protein
MNLDKREQIIKRYIKLLEQDIMFFYIVVLVVGIISTVYLTLFLSKYF